MNRYGDGDDGDVVEKVISREKSYFLPLFENVLIVDAFELCFS